MLRPGSRIAGPRTEPILRGEIMKGEVVYLYAFDVADELPTAKIEKILTNKPFPFEVRIRHSLPKDIPLYKPLAVELSPLSPLMAGRSVQPLVRIYEVGVVSIIMRVGFEAEHLAQLLPFHKAVLANGQTLDQVARDLCADVCQSLGDIMPQAAAPLEPEAYTVFCITSVQDGTDASAWLAENRRAVAELLSESESGDLSEVQVDEVLRIQRSYSKRDQTVIDWDAALVMDLTGYVDDVLYVLELANLQLEEYRVMDQRLDRYLGRAYEDVRRPRFGLFGAYAAVLSKLRLFRVDITKLNDEATHITKFIGDWYLARVYLGARERFHLNQWRSSVEDRLAQLDQLYTVVHNELSNRRMVWLEIIIVLLFVIDLAAIFLLKK